MSAFSSSSNAEGVIKIYLAVSATDDELGETTYQVHGVCDTEAEALELARKEGPAPAAEAKEFEVTPKAAELARVLFGDGSNNPSDGDA